MEEFEKFYNKALKFLSYRPRSEKEVRDKLKILIKRHSGEQSESRIDSGVSRFDRDPQNDGAETLSDKIIQKLKEQKFINDEEFAKLWIESRNRSKPRSLRLIKLELKRKGIDSEIIDKMINDEGLMINDLESAKRLVERKLSRSRNPSASLRAGKFGMTPEKLGRFLASKGFDWDTIKQVIDEVLNERV